VSNYSELENNLFAKMKALKYQQKSPVLVVEKTKNLLMVLIIVSNYHPDLPLAGQLLCGAS